MHHLRTNYGLFTDQALLTDQLAVTIYILQLIQTIHDHGHGMSIGP